VYTIDEQDSVVELPGVPRSDPGATFPIVFAEEQDVVLSYSLAGESPDDLTRMLFAVVRFGRPCFYLFGPPNDEALAGHPLAGRGLRSYGAFRVDHSSLVRHLERMNSVHDRDNPVRFARLIHYIFTFHDSFLQCVAESLDRAHNSGSSRLTGVQPACQRATGVLSAISLKYNSRYADTAWEP
jgi:hypothetical protein